MKKQTTMLDQFINLLQNDTYKKEKQSQYADARKQAEDFAIYMKVLFDSLTKKGFTREETLDMIKIILKNSYNKENK